MKKAYILTASTLFFLHISGSHAQTFVICEGEKSEAGPAYCHPYDTFASCYTANARATAICAEHGATGNPKLIIMDSVGGNHCGYTNIKVICQAAPRKPTVLVPEEQLTPQGRKDLARNKRTLQK
jgi:hypothetical protein